MTADLTVDYLADEQGFFVFAANADVLAAAAPEYADLIRTRALIVAAGPCDRAMLACFHHQAKPIVIFRREGVDA